MAPLREGPLLWLHSFLYQCLVVGVCLFDIKREPLVWELAWGSVKLYSKSMVDRCVLLHVGSWYCFQAFLLSGVMSLQEVSNIIKMIQPDSCRNSFLFFFFYFVQGLSSCVFRTCAAFPFERDQHIFKLWTGFHQMTKNLLSFTFYYFWKT